MIRKRAFDLLLALPGLLILSPLFVVLGVWIKCDSRGPVFFRQMRVGRGGDPFWIYKFRTMVQDAERVGDKVTVGNDLRLTNTGRYLRKYKLDELPQLINVVKGDMSLVGPRPEVPEFVDLYPESSKRKVLSVRPGVTDRASLEFREENELLGQVEDPRDYYVTEILPRKLAYYEDYVDNNSIGRDCKLILRTIRHLIR